MNKFKDPAIIILISTVFSYGMAFIYQRGYKRYYQLPETFIDLDITTMSACLFSALILFILIAAIWEWTQLFYLILVRFRLIENFSESFIKYIRKNSMRFFVTFTALMIIVSSLFGRYSASHLKEYLVIKQKEHLFVIVTSYKDSLIIAPLDLEKESITPTFKAIEVKNLKDAEMIRFENGLKVEDMKNSKDLNE